MIQGGVSFIVYHTLRADVNVTLSYEVTLRIRSPDILNLIFRWLDKLEIGNVEFKVDSG